MPITIAADMTICDNLIEPLGYYQSTTMPATNPADGCVGTDLQTLREADRNRDLKLQIDRLAND